jgi:uncharacterized protein YbbK (DUF523 family)
MKRHPLVAAIDPRLVIPVCPEVDCGLSVPRDPIRIELHGGQPRLRVIRTGVDLTGQMDAWIEGQLAALAGEGIGGCVLKSRSPSCGLTRVPRFFRGEVVAEAGGLFAEAVARRFPGLPLLEDDLLDIESLDRFFTTLGLKSYK